MYFKLQPSAYENTVNTVFTLLGLSVNFLVINGKAKPIARWGRKATDLMRWPGYNAT